MPPMNPRDKDNDSDDDFLSDDDDDDDLMGGDDNYTYPNEFEINDNTCGILSSPRNCRVE